MEKRRILWTLLTGIGVSLVIVAGTMAYTAQQPGAREMETSDTETQPSGYLLRIDNGQLALFRAGSSVPYQRLDMPLNLLSEYDYAQLEQGVTAETEEEMRRLVEDYTS